MIFVKMTLNPETGNFRMSHSGTELSTSVCKMKDQCVQRSCFRNRTGQCGQGAWNEGWSSASLGKTGKVLRAWASFRTVPSSGAGSGRAGFFVFFNPGCSVEFELK